MNSEQSNPTPTELAKIHADRALAKAITELRKLADQATSMALKLEAPGGERELEWYVDSTCGLGVYAERALSQAWAFGRVLRDVKELEEYAS